MTYKSKNCIGCPDAKNGCQLTCLKVQPAKKQEKRPIAEVVKEACEIFGKYEITKGELARAEELRDKLENQKITVSVIGQFKRGKKYIGQRDFGGQDSSGRHCAGHSGRNDD